MNNVAAEPLASLNTGTILGVRLDTGEILEERTLPPCQPIPSKPLSLESCRDKQEVLEWAGEDTPINIELGRSSERLRWTNAAMETVLGSNLTKDQAQKFTDLCELIVARNVILEDHTRDIAEHLSVNTSHISGYLKTFEKNGLIRFHRRNVFGRGRHIILVNPTICWRGYLHAGGDDVDEVGNIPYSAASFFSRDHKKAVQRWTRAFMRSDRTADTIIEEASLNWLSRVTLSSPLERLTAHHTARVMKPLLPPAVWGQATSVYRSYLGSL